MVVDCIFCSIVTGSAPAHIVWEDATHVAFLSIFPNTDGLTVVIPKQHYGSYVFDAPEGVVVELLSAARIVAQKIDKAFPDVGRTGVVFEGFGVNHLHVKLYPLHGTEASEWKPRVATSAEYILEYPGYITTQEGPRAQDDVLKTIAAKIKNT